jgi:hypothetical protein
VKLLSTEIGENSVELTNADNPELDDASMLLIARVAMKPHEGKSVALNRYVALKQLQDFIREQMNADELISNTAN